eukprot:scaffold47934_cov17-Tisochrysis_lutea.AAC.1
MTEPLGGMCFRSGLAALGRVETGQLKPLPAAAAAAGAAGAWAAAAGCASLQTLALCAYCLDVLSASGPRSSTARLSASVSAWSTSVSAIWWGIWCPLRQSGPWF